MSDPDFPDTQDEAREHIQEIQDYYVGELDEETRLVDTTRESIAQMDKEFSGPQSVFLEFIQNAVDATSENNDCTISFEFYKDNLVVRNNADPFSHSDVESICTPRVRYGDDADNPDHIGF